MELRQAGKAHMRQWQCRQQHNGRQVGSIGEAEPGHKRPRRHHHNGRQVGRQVGRAWFTQGEREREGEPTL